MQGNGRGGRELNRHILDCGSTGELCELIEAHAEEFDAVNVSTAFRKLLQSQRSDVPRGVVERAQQAIEAAALRTMDAFKGREVANILHIMAKMCYRPWDLIRTLLLFERLRGGRRHWRALQQAARGKHAVGVCDDGERARGRGDSGAGGAGGGGGGHV